MNPFSVCLRERLLSVCCTRTERVKGTGDLTRVAAADNRSCDSVTLFMTVYKEQISIVNFHRCDTWPFETPALPFMPRIELVHYLLAVSRASLLNRLSFR